MAFNRKAVVSSVFESANAMLVYLLTGVYFDNPEIADFKYLEVPLFIFTKESIACFIAIIFITLVDSIFNKNCLRKIWYYALVNIIGLSVVFYIIIYQTGYLNYLLLLEFDIVKSVGLYSINGFIAIMISKAIIFYIGHIFFDMGKAYIESKKKPQ
ncbi:MAG TPA: hypothetical protein DCL21_07400 [Alphaproteobacteria bacterium]|nr:hypothetical protein [Alphaproteobacteria bacterium]